MSSNRSEKCAGGVPASFADAEASRDPSNLMGHLTPRLVSIKAAAHCLGVSRGTVYNLIDSGDLRARKIRGRTLISVDELDRFVDSLVAG
jgi:excisionase family DNA binding protein